MRRLPYLVAVSAALLAAAPVFAQQRNISDTALAAQTCNVCHGSASYVSPTMPPIHGVDATTLFTALTEFKTDKRPYTIMGRIARGYSDEQLKALAEYLSKN
ncbi:sulfide dehydrogenase [uncultured Ferrovibrio sp.]|jgi:sulfide dehydrogenase cytochrome subunit|uniref:c-type cytochrome n=1 Tax=uncultured Ferrovibrio sp. TaxID=1576913 RepID=UPI0026362B2D|nr:sulfide dehydrogenase [uncultured Ferrovibrio sp.]